MELNTEPFENTVRSGELRTTKKRLTTKRLRHIAEAKNALVKGWKEGVSIESDSGGTVTEIMQEIAVARFRLARDHLGHAKRLVHLKPPEYRPAVSRFYYAMYHAMRACVYIHYEGDDHNAHNVLPLKVPADFPQSDWQTRLKDAHFSRNMADYDPYPMPWKKIADKLGNDADELLKDARKYLKDGGCDI